MAELKIRATALSVLEKKAVEYATERPRNLIEARAFVDRTWNKFDAAHDILVASGLGEDSDAVHLQFYCDAERIRQKCMDLLVTEIDSSQLENHAPRSASILTSEAQFIKLAPIKLMTFRGELMTWLEFRDQFTSLVHSKDSMDDHHKLAVLREKALVSMVSGNYTGGYVELWEKLCERYNDEFALAEAWAKTFADIPKATDTMSGLLALIDATRSVLRAFNQLKMDISKSPLTIFGFLEKLPSAVRLAWGTARTETGVPLLEECLQFLERRAKNLPASIAPTKASSPAPIAVHRTRVHVGTVPPMTRCACPQNHSLVKYCSAFKNLTIQERVNLFNDKGQCYACFGDHPGAECQAGRTCYECQGPHNTWFCPVRAGRSAAPSREPRPAMRPQNLPRH